MIHITPWRLRRANTSTQQQLLVYSLLLVLVDFTQIDNVSSIAIGSDVLLDHATSKNNEYEKPVMCGHSEHSTCPIVNET